MSLLAKIGGFFVVPVIGGVIGRVLIDPNKDSLETAAYKGAAAHTLVTLAAYWGSKKLESRDMADFSRGGMWGSGTSALFLVATPSLVSGAVKSLPLAQLSTENVSARLGTPSNDQKLGSAVKLLATAQT